MKLSNTQEFCKLVDRIDTITKKLEKAEDQFYDGGTSFEDVYAHEFEELEKEEQKLKDLLVRILM